MTKLNKPGSVRNYILRSFLINYKHYEPYLFWPNEKYFGEFEPKVKEILASSDTLVILNTHQGVIPYQGPFNLFSKEKIYGWTFGNLKDRSVYTVYVPKGLQGQGFGKELIERLYIDFEEPPEMKIVFPTRKVFNFIKHTLGGRCIIKA